MVRSPGQFLLVWALAGPYVKGSALRPGIEGGDDFQELQWPECQRWSLALLIAHIDTQKPAQAPGNSGDSRDHFELHIRVLKALWRTI